MEQLLKEFKLESEELIKELLGILDDVEGRFDQRLELDGYGQKVDRIMGGSKSLAMSVDKKDRLEYIGRYAELCKLVGYKASQIENNEHFYNIVIGFLMDATEMLEEMVITLNTPQEKDLKELVSETFLERLRFINQQFDENTRGTLSIEEGDGRNTVDQNEIDDLLKALGI